MGTSLVFAARASAVAPSDSAPSPTRFWWRPMIGFFNWMFGLAPCASNDLTTPSASSESRSFGSGRVSMLAGARMSTAAYSAAIPLASVTLGSAPFSSRRFARS